MRPAILSVFFFLCGLTAVGQFDPDFQEKPRKPFSYTRLYGSIGIGYGLDYGVFGGKFSYHHDRNVDLFAGVGYNRVGLGFNFGTQIKVLNEGRIIPKLVAMYGSNAVIKVINAGQYDKIYYGPSVGIGAEVAQPNSRNFGSLEVIVPFWSAEYKRDVQQLKNNPTVSRVYDPRQISLSIGYHFGF